VQRLVRVFLACCFCNTAAAAADEALPVPASGGEALLVTYGPGDIYWQRFGHNAIWLREPALELDHTINFGFFDFGQEQFLWRFVQGRMLYFSAAQPSEREFSQYRGDNRSIRVQRLDLTAAQYRDLRDRLLFEIRPENREYLYDYYHNNCSTRVRDVLDEALGGALRNATRDLPAELNLRAHTSRSSSADLWLYLGLEMALGRPVDQPVSRWDEMFLPSVVADVVESGNFLNPATGRPLVSADEQLYISDALQPPPVPVQRWPAILALAVALALVLTVAARYMPPAWGDGLAMAWMLVGGTAGLFMLFAWFFTDHEVARWNANLLLLHPLMLLALVPALRPGVVLLTAAAALVALALQWLPNHQYNADVLAAVLPLSTAAAMRLWKNRVA
jgi:hypothetical protein